MNEIIQFKKKRELGSILTDTFKFIRLNWKLLYSLILKIAGPALLIVLFALIYYLQSTMGSMGPLSSPQGFDMFTVHFFLSVLLLLTSGIVFYALLYGTVLHFIKSYIKNNGHVIEEEVKEGVKKDFWSLIGLGFLVTIMISFGIMFCVVPGIYLGVTLATTYAILVFEKRDISDTISYSFQLIKDEFWNTFATLIVIFVLYYVIVIIFQIPQYIYFFVRTFTMSQEISSDPSSMFDWVYICLNSLAMVAQYLSYPLIVISTVFIYFNLNEKKNFTGTLEAIDAIGNEES